VGPGWITTHYGREKNTTGGARQTHHAPSIREKYDGWGVGGSPCTIDGRIRRQVRRGRLTTHHRREKNTTGEACGIGHASSKREKYDEWGAGTHNRKITATSQRL